MIKPKLPLGHKLAILIKGKIGLILLLVGIVLSVIAYSFNRDFDWRAYYYLKESENLVEVKAKITNTYYWEGEDSYTMGYEYVFSTEEGAIEGISYCSNRDPLKVNDVVRVEYHPKNPQLSRIKGLRANRKNGAIIIIVIVLASWITLLYYLYTGYKNLKLIQSGRIAFGRLKKKEKTNVSVNEEPVYKLTFSFTASDGKEYQSVAKSHRPEKMLDEVKEMIIYAPNNPEKSIVVDALPWFVPRFIKENWPQS